MASGTRTPTGAGPWGGPLPGTPRGGGGARAGTAAREAPPPSAHQQGGASRFSGERQLRLTVGTVFKGWYWGRAADGRVQLMCRREPLPSPGDPPGDLSLLDLPAGLLDGLTFRPRRRRTWVVATVGRVDAAGAHWDVRVVGGLGALAEAEFFVGGRRGARR